MYMYMEDTVILSMQWRGLASIGYWNGKDGFANARECVTTITIEIKGMLLYVDRSSYFTRKMVQDFAYNVCLAEMNDTR